MTDGTQVRLFWELSAALGLANFVATWQAVITWKGAPKVRRLVSRPDSKAWMKSLFACSVVGSLATWGVQIALAGDEVVRLQNGVLREVGIVIRVLGLAVLLLFLVLHIPVTLFRWPKMLVPPLFRDDFLANKNHEGE